MKLCAVKLPALAVLDFKSGQARRYLRVFDHSGAGLGWQLKVTHDGTFDPAVELQSESVEQFRVTGK